MKKENALRLFFLKLPQFLNLNWTVGVAHPPLCIPLLSSAALSPRTHAAWWLESGCFSRGVSMVIGGMSASVGSGPVVSAGVTPAFSARVTGTIERGG